MRSLGAHLLVAVLCLAVSLGGCIGDASGAASLATTSAGVAPAPNVTADLGSISGSIVDDEKQPIVDATVTLVGAELQTRSDANGAYTVNGVEPGAYGLVVTRAGYQQLARKVEVVAGEVAKADFVLLPIRILDPHYLVLSKVAYIHAAWLYFTHAAWSFGVNNSGVNELFCDPCRFTQFHPAGAMGVMTETLWRSGPGNAAVNKEVWLQYMLNVTAEQPSGKVVATGYWSDRESIRWTSKDVFRKADKHELWVQAGLLNVNVEHKVETFTVLAYDTEFPDGFSVLPPK